MLGLGLGLTTRRGGVRTLVSDTFTRADNASSLGTADTGQAWTAHAGVWGISSNQAYTATGASNALATLDAGVSECSASVTITTPGAGWGGVVLRGSDASNYLTAFWSNGSQLFFRKIVAGVATDLVTQATRALQAGDVLTVRASGTSLQAIVNGAVILSATDSFNQTATRCGLYTFSSDTAARFDTFTVTA